MIKLKSLLLEEDYRGMHKAPNKDSAPLYDLTRVYPDDIYSYNAIRYYGHGEPTLDQETMRIIWAAHNKPDKKVNIYRAVPREESVEEKINRGDWVTINKKYAIMHGRSTLHGKYKILTKTVLAKELFTNGDSIHEWGYNP